MLGWFILILVLWFLWFLWFQVYKIVPIVFVQPVPFTMRGRNHHIHQPTNHLNPLVWVKFTQKGWEVLYFLV